MLLVLGWRSKADHPGPAAAVPGWCRRSRSDCSPTASCTDPAGSNHPDWSAAASPGSSEAGDWSAPWRQTGASGKPARSPDAGKSCRSGRTAKSPHHSAAGATTAQPTRSQGEWLCLFKFVFFNPVCSIKLDFRSWYILSVFFKFSTFFATLLPQFIFSILAKSPKQGNVTNCFAVFYFKNTFLEFVIYILSLLLLSQYQLVSGAGNAGGPQVLQISQAQGGQRVAVPIKMLLQPQVDFLMRTYS